MMEKGIGVETSTSHKAFIDFDKKVRDHVRAVATRDDDKEVLEDLATNYYDKVVLDCFARGFSPAEAGRYMALMSQRLDEDYAIEHMALISRKHGSLYQRATAIWMLARHFKFTPDADDMDVMRKALMKGELPKGNDDYDIKQWIEDGWLVKKEG